MITKIDNPRLIVEAWPTLGLAWLLITRILQVTIYLPRSASRSSSRSTDATTLLRKVRSLTAMAMPNNRMM